MTFSRILPTSCRTIGSAAAAGALALGLLTAGSAAAAPAPRLTAHAAAAASTTGLGVVDAIGRSSIAFVESNGTSVVTTIPASAVKYFTSNSVLRLCETAVFAYQKTSKGTTLDTMIPVGVSTASSVSLGSRGTCASTSDGEVDRVGLITALSPSSVTMFLLGAGTATFPLAPGRDLQSNEAVGDLADVTYNPSNDTAYNLETSELYMTGTVTKVSNHSITIRNSFSGLSETLAPDAAAYIKIRKGNVVGIDYYLDAGKPRADNVADLTNGVSN
jgi:hypothetical protein